MRRTNNSTSFWRAARPAAFALVCIASLTRAAHGSDEPLALALEAPSECGGIGRIQTGVRELIHGAPREPLRASLLVRSKPEGYWAELRTESTRLRSFSAPSCEGIVEAVIVILALAIDPQASTSQSRSPASPGKRPAEVGQRGSPLEFKLGAGLALDSSTLPHAAGGVTGRAGLGGKRWSALAEGTYWLPAHGSLQSDPALGGRFTWWTLGVSACGAPFAGYPLSRFSLCLSPELGRLEGTGTGARTNRPAAATWFAVTLAPTLSLPLNREVALRAATGLAATLLGSRPFVVDRAGRSEEVHRPARFSVRAAVGLDIAL